MLAKTTRSGTECCLGVDPRFNAPFLPQWLEKGHSISLQRVHLLLEWVKESTESDSGPVEGLLTKTTRSRTELSLGADRRLTAPNFLQRQRKVHPLSLQRVHLTLEQEEESR